MASRFGVPQLGQAASTTTASTTTAPTTPAQKLTYEQLPADIKKAVEDVQRLFSERSMADEIQQKSVEHINRVTEDSQLLIEIQKLDTLHGVVNQDNQDALALKKEYTALLRTVDQLTSQVERASASGTASESGQVAWDNYELANLPSKYFRDLVGAFESRMLEYRQTIETIEKFVETSGSMKLYTPATLREVMQAQLEYFMTLSAQVAVLHDELQDLQGQCIDSLKQRYGDSIENPFIDPYAPKPKKEKKKPVPPPFQYDAPPTTQQQTGTSTTGTFGAKPGFGATGLGTQKPAFTPSGFGSTTAATAATAGTTASKPGFGSTGGTTGGFGAKPTGFGAKPTGFGGTAAATGGTTGGFGKPGFGTGTTGQQTGFGSTAKPTSFGGAKPGGFGGGFGQK